MADITSANSILTLSAASVFAVPTQLQGFAQDDAYSMASVETTENFMGVDGIKSAGYIPQMKELEVTLQADSPSIDFFEAIYAAQEAAQAPIILFGALSQPSISRSYVLANGTLKGYKPISDAKKVLQSRKFSILFQVALGAPI